MNMPDSKVKTLFILSKSGVTGFLSGDKSVSVAPLLVYKNREK